MIEKTNDKPTLPEGINYVISQRLAGINTGIPGTITKYDGKGLAEVQIDIKQLFEDGEQVAIPPLQNVPVEQYRSNGGNSYVSLPIKKGDTGWIKFSQRTIDNWIPKGGIQDMTSLRMFDLSDAVFFPGLYPSENAVPEDNESVVLRHEGTKNTLSAEGHEMVTETGGRLALTDKIAIGNTAGELLDLFNALLTQLKIAYGVSPVGPAPMDPVTITELTRIQTVLSLMKE